MGACWGSPSSNSTPGTTGQISSVISSLKTGSTVSTAISNLSTSSQFSAASGDEACSSGQILPTPNMRFFTFAELKNATRNFRNDTVLGEGGFGKVYKGWLDEKIASKTGTGSVIAVKKLSSESMQGWQEWRAEVNFLGRLSHPNLVRLLGYCVEEKELLLVYEFMQKGSLENHLFGRGQPLPWETRMKIVIGAARGLTFLHTSDKQIIYRDFKTSNILLDGSYNAKLSDFGLARMGPSASQSHVSTGVIGTYGYAAPEYIETGHLYLKSDVYGFGVVLIEVLTGLRALDSTRPTAQQKLTEWIQPHLSDRRKLKKIMDPKLGGTYPTKAAERTAQLALKCISSEQKARPSMKEVIDVLQGINGTSERPREPRSRSGHNVAPNPKGQQFMQHRSPINLQHEMHSANHYLQSRSR